MTTEQAPPEADETSSDDATEGRPAQTVRVPNVSPNAKSGLDHTIIGSNALADAGEEHEPDDEAQDDGDDGDVPQGDLDAALAWLGEAEDSDTARERADAVWKVYRQGDDPDDSPANADLATRLRAAVYGDPGTSDPGAGTPTDGDPQTEQTGTGDPNATDADES